MNPATAIYHQTKEEIHSEESMILSAQKDPSRFDVLYKKYFEQIWYFIAKRVETNEITDDITSQVFLKALTKISSYRNMGLPFSSWLFRIARNEVYNYCNDHTLGMIVSAETGGVRKMISEMDAGEKEDHSGLYAALEKLDDDDMELIELRFFEQRAFKEIGEILDITENNAKVRTYRILDKLKTLLKNER